MKNIKILCKTLCRYLFHKHKWKFFENSTKEWAEERENGFRYTDGQIEVACYNDIGEELYIEFDSMDELLMSINSIRMIDLQTEIISGKDKL